MWADYMHVNIHVLPILQILLFYKVIVPKDIHDMARHPYGQSPETTELLRKNVQTSKQMYPDEPCMHSRLLGSVYKQVCVWCLFCVCAHMHI